MRMKINTFLYTLKEGLVGLIRNKWYTLASIATISACLFLLGVFTALLMNVQYVVKNVQKGVSVTVYFVEEVSEDDKIQLKNSVSERDGVERVRYVTAEEAWAEFVVMMELEDFVDAFKDNPLEDSSNLEIYLNDVDTQADLVEFLEADPIVRDVKRSEFVASTLSGLNSIAGYASIGIIGLLLAVSMFLISNTVIVGISIRQEEINIMKYVGATDFFVRVPFIIEGVVIGVLGAVIPLLSIYFLYNKMMEVLVTNFASLSSLFAFLEVGEIYAYLLPGLLGIGAGIGFIVSYMTCRRHLKV